MGAADQAIRRALSVERLTPEWRFSQNPFAVDELAARTKELLLR
jgi:hypothetical protein